MTILCSYFFGKKLYVRTYHMMDCKLVKEKMMKCVKDKNGSYGCLETIKEYEEYCKGTETDETDETDETNKTDETDETNKTDVN